MLIGYARISTTDQDLALQQDALRQIGCERIFEDKASGASENRPGLKAALAFVRKGDSLVVWKLDRLGRSMPHLVRTIAELEERGVAFRSLTEAIDTATPAGRLLLHVFGSLAQFERDLIRERTVAGLAAAKARGQTGGRRSVVTPDKLKKARALMDNPGLTVREAAVRLKISKTSLYRALKEAGAPTSPPADSPLSVDQRNARARERAKRRAVLERRLEHNGQEWTIVQIGRSYFARDKSGDDHGPHASVDDAEIWIWRT